MATEGTVRVAAVQGTPVFLHRAATIDKAVELTADAAADGAQLVVFPESFVPSYPDWVWRTKPWDGDASALWARLTEEAVVVGSRDTDVLATAARDHGVHLSIGVTEREADGSSVWNTALLFGPDGTLLQRHRKIMPTGGERLVWAQGDGSSLHPVTTGIGRISTLICWENLMPLARTALYAQGTDIHLAPTWDNSDGWIGTLQHIAREGRVFVVGVTPCLRGSDIPEDVPGRSTLWGGEDDWMSKGNTTIVGPGGDLLAGPLVGEEGIVVADLDLGEVAVARQQFDAVGHYARPDLFDLRVTLPPPS